MESFTNHSRIGIQLGEPLDGVEKTSIKAAVHFGKGAVDSQIEKLKTMINAEDPNLSGVLVLTPVSGKHQQLEDALRKFLDGDFQGNFAAKISGPFKDGVASYNIIHSGPKLVLHIKPGPAFIEQATQTVSAILNLGVQDLAETDKATLEVNFLSGIDFYELLEFHKKKYTSIAAFWTSSVIEVVVKAIAGSQLDAKLLDILKQMNPLADKGPLSLTRFLTSIDVDVSFRSTEEMPDSMKRKFATAPHLDQFPKIEEDQKQKEVCRIFEAMTEALQPDVGVYFTIDKVAAVDIQIKTPGFGAAFTSVEDKDF